MSGIYYQHSGKAPLWGSLICLLLGGLIAIFFSAAYAWISWLIPRHYHVCAGAILLCCVMTTSLLTYFLLLWKKCRNITVATGILLFTQLVGFYASWVVWAALHSHEANYGLPHLLWQQIRDISATGVWSVRLLWSDGPGTIVSGGALWFLWLFEALIFWGSAVICSTMLSDKNVYCETCERWCEEEDAGLVIAPLEFGPLRQALESKSFEQLRPLSVEESLEGDSVALDFDWCKQCQGIHTVSARYLKRIRYPASEDAVETTLVVRNLLVSEAELTQLRSLRQAQ